MSERKIGEQFKEGRNLLECVEDGSSRCPERCFYNMAKTPCYRNRDLTGTCSSEEREDGKSACFIKVNQPKKKKTVWHEPSDIPEQCKTIVFDQDTVARVGQFVSVDSDEWAVVLCSGTGIDHLVSIKPCKWAYLDDLKKC